MKLLMFIFCFLAIGAMAQPSIQWQKSLGGPGNDFGTSIALTSDGGYIVTGGTYSDGGDVSGFKGFTDFWVAKLDSTGSLQWQKCLGGTQTEQAYWVEQTSDGGFILSGSTSSNDGDVDASHGNEEAWVVKLASDGSLEWQKSLGGSLNEIAHTAKQTSDGGYIIGAHNSSSDGDATSCQGFLDLWLVKLDPSGNLLWQKSYGGSDLDQYSSAIQTSDGGYLLAGLAASTDGDVTGNHGGQDAWVLKLDSAGNVQWKKCIGGSASDAAYSIIQCADGAFIFAGQTFSNNGDVSGQHGQGDAWIFKMDGSGNLLWQKCLGGSSKDAAYSVRQTVDGGYIIAGETASLGGDVSGKHGGPDYWVVKLDGNGSIQWQKCLGGNATDRGGSIAQTTDQGWIIAGESNSTALDVSGNHGQYDFWVVKLNPFSTGVSESITQARFTLFPNPAQERITISGLEEHGSKTYRIFDSKGMTVLSGMIDPGNNEILLHGLFNGLYTIVTEEGSSRLLVHQK